MQIEYIETNASWHIENEHTTQLLRKLKSYGVDTLLISIDPFHNEYIPFYKTKGLIDACKNVGMTVFPWKMEFWDDLDIMGDQSVHSLDEYEERFGVDYLDKLLQRYSLNFKGRALQSFKGHLKSYSLKEILRKSSSCSELSGIHHFHIDLYGNFVPQSCPGLSIGLEDLADGVTQEKYPILFALDAHGVRGLYNLSVEQYGFQAKENYIGKCDLCQDIRSFLVLKKKVDFQDMQPKGHYEFL